jgi:two-component system chemotaxis sensor kinase CheA
MDISRYKGLFLSEAAEYLRNLDQGVVLLERDPRNQPVLEEVFRSAHSLKGMSGAMGYQEILTIAHGLEDLLEPMRRRGEMRPGTADVLLGAVDAMRGLVTALEEGRSAGFDLDDLMQRIREAQEEPLEILDLPAEVPPPQVSPAPPAEPAPPAPSGESWKREWLLRAEVAGTCSTPGVRAFIVHRKTSALGEVAGMRPSLQQIKAGEFRGSLEITLRSVLEREEIERVLSSIPDLASYAVEAAQEVETAPPPPATAVMPGTAPAVPVSPRAPVPLQHRGATSTVRVRTDLLDEFMDSVADLLMAKSRIQEATEHAGNRDLAEAVEQLERSVRQVHDRVMAVRLTPVGNLLERLPRVVRDLAVRRGRRVRLELSGGDVELDRAVVEAVDTPLLHLLRNAIDHGIEPPDERAALGKHPDGSLAVSARRERGEVVVEVADDGRGIDPARVREVALRREILPRDLLEAMDDRAAIELICLPGFSTTSEVSDTSGRGVGMDVVKTSVESLGGHLEIASQVGVGTRIAMRLPATVSMVNVLAVLSGGHVYAFPVTKVERAVLATAEALDVTGAVPTYLRQGGDPVPIHSLELVLGIGPGKPFDPPLPLVLVAVERGLLGLAVDAFLGLREVVLRTLGKLLDRIEGLSGITLLGDGRPAFLLDAARLCRGLSAGGAE